MTRGTLYIRHQSERPPAAATDALPGRVHLTAMIQERPMAIWETLWPNVPEIDAIHAMLACATGDIRPGTRWVGTDGYQLEFDDTGRDTLTVRRVRRATE